VNEALATLRDRCSADNGRRAGPVSYIDPTSWYPSARRYLGYVQALHTGKARTISGSPPSLCLLVLDIRGLVPSSVDDTTVEIYEGVYAEESRNCDMKLVTDENSYIVQYIDHEQGALLLDLSPRGRRPLMVQGDVCIRIQLANRLGVCCRYFFHTSFIVPGRHDLLQLTQADFDFDRDVVPYIPENFSVSMILSDKPPRRPEDFAVPEASMPLSSMSLSSSLRYAKPLSVAWPDPDRRQFSSFT